MKKYRDNYNKITNSIINLKSLNYDYEFVEWKQLVDTSNFETDKMQIARDMNGWYLKVRNPSTVTSTTTNPIFINPYSRKWNRE